MNATFAPRDKRTCTRHKNVRNERVREISIFRGFADIRGSQKGIVAAGRGTDVPCLVPSLVRELQPRKSTSPLVATKEAATVKQMLQKERSQSRQSKDAKTVDASLIDGEQAYLIASRQLIQTLCSFRFQ